MDLVVVIILAEEREAIIKLSSHGKTNLRARAGSIIIRINREFYEIPDTFLFKSHDNQDLYLSAVRNDSTNFFKPAYISTVKFIVEGRFEDVPSELLEKFMRMKYEKIVIDDEEYDIPIQMASECKLKLLKVSKHNPKVLKELKETYKGFKFKSN